MNHSKMKKNKEKVCIIKKKISFLQRKQTDKFFIVKV
jgi:hypothetical protein